MKETDAQKELIDAVQEMGGAGTKLSNRFLSGVADVLIKLPKFQPVLLEAKLAKATKAAGTVTVEPTAIQLRFLSKYAAAGMLTGVISFVARDGHFGVCIVSLQHFNMGPKIKVLLDAHRWGKMGPIGRKELMLRELVEFLEESK